MFRWPKKISLDWQSAVALSLLGFWLLATMGLPINMTITKDLTIAFPCQDHGCACVSAAGCWNNCCCHSFEYRRQWAADHNVTPPKSFWEEAKFARKQQSYESQQTLSCSSSKSCCSKDTKSGSTPKSCQVVIVLDAVKKCQGAPQLIAILSMALLDYQQDPWRVNLDITGSLCQLDKSYISFITTPATPPPSLFV